MNKIFSFFFQLSANLLLVNFHQKSEELLTLTAESENCSTVHYYTCQLNV